MLLITPTPYQSMLNLHQYGIEEYQHTLKYETLWCVIKVFMYFSAVYKTKPFGNTAE